MCTPILLYFINRALPHLLSCILCALIPQVGNFPLHHNLCITTKRSLSVEYLLDIIELVERIHRGEVVDVEVQYLVSNLRQHRVVELKERQLHSLGARSVESGHVGLARSTHLRVVGFELMEDGLCPRHD